MARNIYDVTSLESCNPTSLNNINICNEPSNRPYLQATPRNMKSLDGTYIHSSDSALVADWQGDSLISTPQL